jgi:hypothetical protein
VQEVLVDRRELVAQHFVEVLDDLGVAFHAGLLALEGMTALYALWTSARSDGSGELERTGRARSRKLLVEDKLGTLGATTAAGRHTQTRLEIPQ